MIKYNSAVDKYINVELYASGPLEMWDHIVFKFIAHNSTCTKPVYINEILQEGYRDIKNIGLPEGYQYVEIEVVGEAKVINYELSSFAVYNDWEKQNIIEKTNCINENYFFSNEIADKKYKKLFVTFPGIGGNSSRTSNFNIMKFSNYKFNEDVLMLNFVDFFQNGGTALLYNNYKLENIVFVMDIIAKYQMKYNISDDSVCIFGASKGSLSAFEIFKFKPQFRYYLTAPLLDIDSYNSTNPKLRHFYSNLQLLGYKFEVPEFNENVKLYTSIIDLAYDASRVYNAHVELVDAEHPKITSLVVDEIVSEINSL